MDRWFKHPKHGYMLRRQDPTYAFDSVVTALCQNTAEAQEDEKLWENHKSRMRVNGGSGSVCSSQMHYGDRNREFVSISVEDVPAHIVRDFEAELI